MNDTENTRQSIIAAVDHHMEDMGESELVMVLRFIHSIKDFREVTAV